MLKFYRHYSKQSINLRVSFSFYTPFYFKTQIMPLKQTGEPHKTLEMSELFRNNVNGGLRRPPSSRDFIVFGTTLRRAFQAPNHKAQMETRADGKGVKE